MERDLQYPACIVDANHSNSNKQYMEQIRIVKEVASQPPLDDIRNFVKGVMIESATLSQDVRKLMSTATGNRLRIRVWDGMIPSVSCMRWRTVCKR